jgi:hypothetical protein
MIKYLKEISTQIIYKFQENELPAFPELFEPATKVEILEIELIEAKQIKIKQLKENRNQRLLRPMKFTKAFEIVFDDQGLDVVTDNIVFFEFRVTSTGQPATEPNSLLLNAITKTGDKYIRYSCIIIEGEDSKRGYIQLNSLVANNLLTHIEQRNTSYIKLSNDLETKINNCLTLEEVENIDINVNG